MELDKNRIKVLAVDTRVKILKSLSSRRKMLSELSRELNLANSTISEHLNKLLDVGLIKRVETGNKWVYYELTEDAESMVSPDTTSKKPFTVILSLGVIMILLGSFLFRASIPVQLEGGPESSIVGEIKDMQEAPASGRQPAAPSAMPTLSLIVISIGAVLSMWGLVSFGLYRRKTGSVLF